jgi:hypothetical protein
MKIGCQQKKNQIVGKKIEKKRREVALLSYCSVTVINILTLINLVQKT